MATGIELLKQIMLNKPAIEYAFRDDIVFNRCDECDNWNKSHIWVVWEKDYQICTECFSKLVDLHGVEYADNVDYENVGDKK